MKRLRRFTRRDIDSVLKEREIIDPKFSLSKGRFYCKPCGKMKPIKQKVETFEKLNRKKILVKVECVECYEIRVFV